MPDFTQRADQWFAEKGADLECMQCGSDSFSGGDLLPFYTTDDDGKLQTDQGYWIYFVQCDNCAHVLLFNGSTMGFTPEQLRSS